MNSPATPARILAVIDASGVPGRLEALLPVGVRPRQLSVRTLLAGMLLTLADGRPAHLSRVHGALVGLDDENRRHLGGSGCPENRGQTIDRSALVGDYEHAPAGQRPGPLLVNVRGFDAGPGL